MDRTGIDMWVLISREYNEDPVLKTMLPAKWLNARRRTIILFYRDKQNNSIDKLAVARYNFGEYIISAWDKEVEPNQWKRLNKLMMNAMATIFCLTQSDCVKKKLIEKTESKFPYSSPKPDQLFLDFD